MTGALRKAFTEEELTKQVKEFMEGTYGRVENVESHDDKDAWHERYGLLMNFVTTVWHGDPF